MNLERLTESVTATPIKSVFIVMVTELDASVVQILSSVIPHV